MAALKLLNTESRASVSWESDPQLASMLTLRLFICSGQPGNVFYVQLIKEMHMDAEMVELDRGFYPQRYICTIDSQHTQVWNGTAHDNGRSEVASVPNAG